jgi:hypothetical protein
VARNPERAVRFASAPRDSRESTWHDHKLNQVQLAKSAQFRGSSSAHVKLLGTDTLARQARLRALAKGGRSLRNTRTSAKGRNSLQTSVTAPASITRLRSVPLPSATAYTDAASFGAVRCLTDARVRKENETYLATRFPNREFAMLLRVRVVANETFSPDLQNPEAEWAPNEDDRR